MHIFSKYCTPQPSHGGPHASDAPLMTPPENAVLTPAGLDEWAKDTNGTPFTEEAKEELKEFLDVNDSGDLTLVLILFKYYK